MKESFPILSFGEYSFTEGDHEAFVLHLADNALIMGHRLSEWTGHGPVLEQDIALTNIALDLLGQARNFYQHAASLLNSHQPAKALTEDDLAYFRNPDQFRNFLIAELPNGDWAKTIGKIFFFSAWQYLFYQKLIYSHDRQLAAIAEKSLKEVTYHQRWSSEWVIRLGDGTEESHRRMQAAVEDLWPYTGEMFAPAWFEEEKDHRITVALASLRPDWEHKVKKTAEEATLRLPEEQWMHTGGKAGVHTEHMGYLLAEMQVLQRTYPGLEW